MFADEIKFTPAVPLNESNRSKSEYPIVSLSVVIPVENDEFKTLLYNADVAKLNVDVNDNECTNAKLDVVLFVAFAVN